MSEASIIMFCVTLTFKVVFRREVVRANSANKLSFAISVTPFVRGAGNGSRTHCPRKLVAGEEDVLWS